MSLTDIWGFVAIDRVINFVDRGNWHNKKTYELRRSIKCDLNRIHQLRKAKIYFSIDDERFPYKGVKGKGETIILEDPQKIIPIVEKINLKYLGTLDHPLAKMLIDNTRNGIETVLEITPNFFSTWDFGST